MKKYELFDGRYQILKVLGEGGMSTVYLAENVNLGTLWAIKEINKVSNSRVDLLVEPNILKKLKHPALPRIFDIIEDDRSIYIIEDYIEGIPLDKKLLRCGKVQEQTVIMWARQICDVFLYLHNLRPNPIIYRDMKPSNIILTKDEKIKLIDFGIAREYKSEAENDTAYIGTRGYAAPEQYGTAQTDERTDIYSLGVTLYHLLTGKSPKEAPYEIRPIRELDESLSIGMEYIIEKCTKTNPNQRYQSVEELVRDLENVDAISQEHGKKGISIKFKIAIMIFLLSTFSYITYRGFIETISFFNK
ncbi:serine/threonine-protein kinase [Wukongibacter baidiensis]|uniref:serine/threonine-protein kinase n=1 Tax=Wukongibacter baidiensis TaxID=1723361 RepID=UPI003D7FA768